MRSLDRRPSLTSLLQSHVADKSKLPSVSDPEPVLRSSIEQQAHLKLVASQCIANGSFRRVNLVELAVYSAETLIRCRSMSISGYPGWRRDYLATICHSQAPALVVGMAYYQHLHLQQLRPLPHPPAAHQAPCQRREAVTMQHGRPRKGGAFLLQPQHMATTNTA